jgi:hypothetical protein
MKANDDFVGIFAVNAKRVNAYFFRRIAEAEYSHATV